MISLLKLTPYTGAALALSPNHGARRAPAIEGIVLHATEDEGDEDGTLSWMLSPKSQVSCHLLVSRAGQVTRLVGDRQRAWHAGRSCWRGTHDVNSVTLGIEIANRNDGEPYTDAQYRRVAEIVAHYCRQGLALDDVVAHAEIAEDRRVDDRRTDPQGWDWERFRGMVQSQLRAADDDARWLTYDRRSSERRAAEADGPPSVPAMRAPELGGAAVTTTPAIIPSRQPLPAAVAPTLKPPPAMVPKPEPRATVVTPPKPVLTSRTVWLNGLTVMAAGSVLIAQVLDLAYSVGLSLPERITMWALFVVGAVNIILRFQTTCPIGSNECIDRARNQPPPRVRGREAIQGSGKRV